ncbi:transposase [Streptomyces umbrinus]
MTHIQLDTPVVWWWGNLNVHLVKELADFAEEHEDWLQIFHMPSYTPELNPAEGIWSLLKRHLADFAAADLTHLTRVIQRKLKKIQYRPHLVDGCPDKHSDDHRTEGHAVVPPPPGCDVYQRPRRGLSCGGSTCEGSGTDRIQLTPPPSNASRMGGQVKPPAAGLIFTARGRLKPTWWGR